MKPCFVLPVLSPVHSCYGIQRLVTAGSLQLVTVNEQSEGCSLHADISSVRITSIHSSDARVGDADVTLMASYTVHMKCCMHS